MLCRTVLGLKVQKKPTGSRIQRGITHWTLLTVKHCQRSNLYTVPRFSSL